MKTLPLSVFVGAIAAFSFTLGVAAGHDLGEVTGAAAVKQEAQKLDAGHYMQQADGKIVFVWTPYTLDIKHEAPLPYAPRGNAPQPSGMRK